MSWNPFRNRRVTPSRGDDRGMRPGDIADPRRTTDPMSDEEIDRDTNIDARMVYNWARPRGLPIEITRQGRRYLRRERELFHPSNEPPRNRRGIVVVPSPSAAPSLSDDGEEDDDNGSGTATPDTEPETGRTVGNTESSDNSRRGGRGHRWSARRSKHQSTRRRARRPKSKRSRRSGRRPKFRSSRRTKRL